MDALRQTLAGLEHAIRDLACELRCQNSNQKVLQKIEQVERNIMSHISEYAAKQNAFNVRHAATIDSAVESVKGLTEDIVELNAKIQTLQNSSGPIDAADQVTLDELTVQGEAVTARSEALAAALKTLDSQTPPVPPVT